MEKKTFELEIKELTEAGTFSGYLSTFGNIDAGGDIVEAGAFKKTLRENKAFGFIWSHDSTFHGIIGSLTGKEDAKGLFTEGGFFLELEDGREAYNKAKLLQTKGVKLGLSMGYIAVKPVYDTIEGQTVRRLKEVKLREGSITLWPMNEKTNLLVKEEGDGETETKPYPNHHACVVDESVEVTGSRTQEHNGKKYTVRFGKGKDGKTADRSYLYPKDAWSESEARNHCRAHGGRFEPAKEKGEMSITREQFKNICPEIADLMEKDGIETVNLKEMPEHLLEALCKRAGDDPGFWTRCAGMSWGDIEDTEAFCAWLHHECLGKWPGERDQQRIEIRCGSCGETLTFTELADAAQPKAEPSKAEPSELHSALQKIADELKK